MAGRKPKPTAIKKLEGNPGKRKLNTKEPIPAKGMPECPDWLLLVQKFLNKWTIFLFCSILFSSNQKEH